MSATERGWLHSLQDFRAYPDHGNNPTNTGNLLAFSALFEIRRGGLDERLHSWGVAPFTETVGEALRSIQSSQARINPVETRLPLLIRLVLFDAEHR